METKNGISFLYNSEGYVSCLFTLTWVQWISTINIHFITIGQSISIRVYTTLYNIPHSKRESGNVCSKLKFYVSEQHHNSSFESNAPKAKHQTQVDSSSNHPTYTIFTHRDSKDLFHTRAPRLHHSIHHYRHLHRIHLDYSDPTNLL